jgi:precorrin-4 methylase
MINKLFFFYATEKTTRIIQKGGYPKDTPVSVVYKATWPEQKIIL